MQQEAVLDLIDWLLIGW